MMKPYESYNETNIPWNKTVPSHWKVHRGKNVFYNKKTLNTSYESDNVLSLTLKGVINNNIDNPIGLVPKDYATYQVFNKNDLVFKLIDLENYKTSRVGIVHEKGIMSSAYIRLVNKVDICYRYYYYLYYDLYLRGVYNNLGAGVRSTLSASDLLNIEIILPPRPEQDQIVRYLDWQLSKINKLIKAKKKQIELLNEQKQAIINKAVTKGLDDTVPMKDSGVDWLGEIPEGWDVCRCKYLFKESDLRSTTGTETHLSMSQKLGLIPDNQLNERRMLSENYIGGKLCFIENLVLNRLKAHLGVFALSKYDGVISPDYTVLRINKEKILPKYAEYVLRCNDCRKELRIRVRGVVEGFWRLYTDDFNTITLPVPSIEKQQEILEFIEIQNDSFIKALILIEKELDLLTEYKTALISAVVTGKVDVQDIEIPDFEIDDDQQNIDEIEDTNDVEELEVDS